MWSVCAATGRSTSSTSVPNAAPRLFYTEPSESDLVVVSVGSFADPSFPAPQESGYRLAPARLGCSCRSRSNGTRPSCGNRCDRCTRPAATRGRPTGAARSSRRTRTRATCTTTSPAARGLAGEVREAVEHLGQAIAMRDGCREMAINDSDFDRIRDEQAFAALIAR